MRCHRSANALTARKSVCPPSFFLPLTNLALSSFFFLLKTSSQAYREFKTLASSYYRAYPPSGDDEKLFFVHIDFDGKGNNEVFRKVGCCQEFSETEPSSDLCSPVQTLPLNVALSCQLQCTSAPVLFHVPKGGKPERYNQYAVVVLYWNLHAGLRNPAKRSFNALFTAPSYSSFKDTRWTRRT